MGDIKNRPEDILSNDVHELQSWTNKENDVFDVGRGKLATLEGEHLFHFMFLKNTAINSRHVFGLRLTETNNVCLCLLTAGTLSAFISQEKTRDRKALTFSREYCAINPNGPVRYSSQTIACRGTGTIESHDWLEIPRMRKCYR